MNQENKNRALKAKHKKSPDPNPLATMDLFLTEENLIKLAIQELKGASPSRKLQSFNRPHEANSAEANTKEAQKQTLLAHEMSHRGWSERDLALKAGISTSEAMALARGHQRVTNDIAKKLAAVFATSVDFWLKS